MHTKEPQLFVLPVVDGPRPGEGAGLEGHGLDKYFIAEKAQGLKHGGGRCVVDELPMVTHQEH